MRRKGTQDWKRPEAKQKGTHGPTPRLLLSLGCYAWGWGSGYGYKEGRAGAGQSEGASGKERTRLRIKSHETPGLFRPQFHPSLEQSTNLSPFPPVYLKTMVPSVLNPG